MKMYGKSSSRVSTETPMTVLELQSGSCEWVQYNKGDEAASSKKRKRADRSDA